MDQFRETELLNLGGWHVETARVLVAAAADRIGVALVDTNGDGRCIEFEQFWRDDTGRWTRGASSGPEPDTVGFENRGSVPGADYAYGRTAPGREMTVHLSGRAVETRANEAGWWAVVVAEDDSGSTAP